MSVTARLPSGAPRQRKRAYLRSALVAGTNGTRWIARARVLQSARFPGVGALDPMRAPYACLSIGIAGISYGQELKGRCAKKPL
jgi:hypothetical protein